MPEIKEKHLQGLSKVKKALEKLKNVQDYTRVKSTLLELVNGLNEHYEMNKKSIDSNNPDKGGMAFYIKECNCLHSLTKQKNKMLEWINAIWDLSYLSQKIGFWSKLRSFRKLMQNDVHVILPIWTQEYLKKWMEKFVINEIDGELIRYIVNENPEIYKLNKNSISMKVHSIVDVNDHQRSLLKFYQKRLENKCKKIISYIESSCKEISIGPKGFYYESCSPEEYITCGVIEDFGGFLRSLSKKELRGVENMSIVSYIENVPQMFKSANINFGKSVIW